MAQKLMLRETLQPAALASVPFGLYKFEFEFDFVFLNKSESIGRELAGLRITKRTEDVHARDYSGPLNETPAQIRVVLKTFLPRRAMKTPIERPRALPGNAPDCAIGAFIGYHGQKRFKNNLDCR
jgi:hypothetical protein